jgi:hypothetical protein
VPGISLVMRLYEFARRPGLENSKYGAHDADNFNYERAARIVVNRVSLSEAAGDTVKISLP